MLGVDGNSLQLKSVGFVWRLAVTCRWIWHSSNEPGNYGNGLCDDENQNGYRSTFHNPTQSRVVDINNDPVSKRYDSTENCKYLISCIIILRYEDIGL